MTVFNENFEKNMIWNKLKTGLLKKSFKSLLEQETLSFFFAVMCVLILPVYAWYLPPFMVLWALTRILENNSKRDVLIRNRGHSWWLFFLFTGYYLWQLVGLIYSDNIANGVNIFFSRLSLFIFPLALVIPGKKIETKGKILLKLFAGSTLFFIICCFLNAFYKSIVFQNGQLLFNPHPSEGYWMSYFYGSYFSFNQHPSYLAMYATLSVFIAFESWSDKSIKTRQRILWLVTGIFLLFSIYFLSSRAGFLALVILLPFYFFYKLKKVFKGIIIILSVLVFLLASITILRTNERIGIVLNQISDGTFKEKASHDSRILIWGSSFQIIRNNFILGVGTGDVRDELMKEYKIIGDEDLIKSQYNAHNQFIEIFLENGIIGLILFLTIIGTMIYIAITDKNLLYGVFIIMMVVFFMFETILYRLAGVAFFSLFSFLLLFIPEKEGNNF